MNGRVYKRGTSPPPLYSKDGGGGGGVSCILDEQLI